MCCYRSTNGPAEYALYKHLIHRRHWFSACSGQLDFIGTVTWDCDRLNAIWLDRRKNLWWFQNFCCILQVDFFFFLIILNCFGENVHEIPIYSEKELEASIKDYLKVVSICDPYFKLLLPRIYCTKKSGDPPSFAMLNTHQWRTCTTHV